MKKFMLSLVLIFAISEAALAQTPSQAPSGSSSQNSLTDEVDKIFEEYDKPNSPGCALAVIKDGHILYKRGYGSAHLEYNIPITPSTIFHVASVSKQFTAFAVTMLAQQGKLSLDDDIRKHLPEVPDFGKTITIRHLIHHTSGLRDQWELLAMAGWRLDDVITKAHIMKMVRHQKTLNFDPGQEYLYCNTGYTLLAVIVEKLTGQSFRQYTEANIFKPLSMTNTHFHDDHEMIVKNRAYSYAPDSSHGFRASVLSYANAGATSLFTTVEDLAKWVQNFEDGRVGGAAAIEQMHQQGILNNGEKISYAFAIVIGNYRGLRTIAHSGADAGFRSHLIRFPDQKFAVAILSNLATFDPARRARQVADIYLADQLLPEKPKIEVKLTPAMLDSYVGKYLLQSGLVITVTKENGRLMSQATRQPRYELFPESEAKFFMRAIDAQISFHRDETGKVTELTLHQNNQNTPAKKFEPLNLSQRQLAEFVGEYFSDELGTAYTIGIQNGQLVAQHRRHDDTPLISTFAEQFWGEPWWFRQVHFMRDQEKRVTGFRLSNARVKNLLFDKQAH